MRISDWSSDVCSSDLSGKNIDGLPAAPAISEEATDHEVERAVQRRREADFLRKGFVRRGRVVEQPICARGLDAVVRVICSIELEYVPGGDRCQRPQSYVKLDIGGEAMRLHTAILVDKWIDRHDIRIALTRKDDRSGYRATHCIAVQHGRECRRTVVPVGIKSGQQYLE